MIFFLIESGVYVFGTGRRIKFDTRCPPSQNTKTQKSFFFCMGVLVLAGSGERKKQRRVWGKSLQSTANVGYEGLGSFYCSYKKKSEKASTTSEQFRLHAASFSRATWKNKTCKIHDLVSFTHIF